MNLRRGSDAPCLESALKTPWRHDSPCGSSPYVLAFAPGPVLGEEAYRIPPLTSEAWKTKKIHFDGRTGRTCPNALPSARARFTREYVLKQFWQSFVDERFDLGNAIQTRAEFSDAFAVMDKIEGWEEDLWEGSKFAASMWIYTKAVICNGQDNMQEYRLLKSRSVTEAAKWVCDDVLDDHVWVSELSISCQEVKVLEALQYHLAHPCLVQWSKLWFSASTSPNRRFLNDGVILENTMKQSIWLFRVLSFCPSGGRILQDPAS